MPRIAIKDNKLLSLRIRADEKAILLRAAALRQVDLTEFVRQHSLVAARTIIREEERVQLSERDSILVLELLENPQAPNQKLLAAAKALPTHR